MKTDLAQDTFLVGIGVSPGIAIGETFLLNRSRVEPIERTIRPEEVQGQVDAFREAVQASKDQLEQVKSRVGDESLAEHLYIIDTHLLILEDQMLIDETISLIRSECINAEGALQRVLSKIRQVFDRIEDEYLRERRSDVDSVGDRLLRNLLGKRQQSLSDITRKAIIIAHDLSPADTMQIDREKIIGFITDLGGRTSHTAILGRSLGIPAIVGMETATSFVPGGIPAIMDGTSGTLILNPSEETFREYLKRKQEFEYEQKELLLFRDLPAETTDGFKMALKGNVEVADEVPLIINHGGEGIGLFRTEFLFMNRLFPPSEEEQAKVFGEMISRMSPFPVTIRTLDVGGDKFVPQINLSDEINPAMGLRGVRFSLREVRLFKTQLRAILRSSAHGDVRLLFPMISGVSEIRACKEYLSEAMEELRAEGVPFNPDIPVGAMIETPSAALIPDLLSREVDFFSIGTNDLIQYCLAVDRSNEHVAYLYEPLHPAVLRALKNICSAAQAEGITVGMCGEMASEPLYVPILLGLGLLEISMSSGAIPRVKRILRQMSRSEAEEICNSLMNLETAQEVASSLEDEMTRRFPQIFGVLKI